jgi:hypothetical protein
VKYVRNYNIMPAFPVPMGPGSAVFKPDEGTEFKVGMAILIYPILLWKVSGKYVSHWTNQSSVRAIRHICCTSRCVYAPNSVYPRVLTVFVRASTGSRRPSILLASIYHPILRHLVTPTLKVCSKNCHSRILLAFYLRWAATFLSQTSQMLLRGHVHQISPRCLPDAFRMLPRTSPRSLHKLPR